MQEKELEFYEKRGNWNFSDIKCFEEKITDWDYFEEIEKNTNEKSLCLDLGTGGGENVLKNYPKVGMIIGTDFSKGMIETARKNSLNFPEKNVKFVQMNSLEMKFPNETFDLISARHTIINAEQILKALAPNGVLVIEGVDRKDCWEIKELFGRGQGYKDEIGISEKDYIDLKNAGFSKVEKIDLLFNEYYETEEDLLNLLIETPILDDFSEIEGNFVHSEKIEKEIFDEYVKKFKTEKGILLKRVYYGIVAKK